jgi:pyruvate/2-oxoglutarate dehydrogenase complex dihydrolipoamide acyltransferase (E2) component
VTGPLKFTGIRGVIARRMLESVQTTAQLSFFADADASALTEARGWWKEAGQKIGYEDLAIAALARVLPAFPLFNAHEVDGAVVPQAEINVGVAIGLPLNGLGGALVVPCVFDCAAKSLPEIAAERASLVQRAPINKLTVKEMSAGTISLSNLGLTRVRHFTPVLNRPQTAIIGLGRIGRDGLMGISLTVDHRAIDGQPAGEFLTALCEALEGPQPTLLSDPC